MLRKMMMALLATAALGVLAPDALARGGGGGEGHGGGGGFGGFHGGGGGWHGGGMGGGAAFRAAPMGGGVAFHHAGMAGPHFVPGFHRGFHHRRIFVAGIGFIGPYYDDYYPYSDYPDQVYYDGGYVESGCSLVRQRVHTRHGWRYRTVQICQ